MPLAEWPRFTGSRAGALPLESTATELGHGLAWLLEQADLREVLRKSAQIVGLHASVALPRQIASGSAGSGLRGPHVLAELVGGEPAGPHGFALALPVEQAAGLVDRMLGGAGSVGIGAEVGALSDAECGVLAYLTARCCAVSPGSLRVADVTSVSADELAARWPGGLSWPIRVATDGLALDLAVLFERPSHGPTGSVQLELLVREELASGALSELEVGDLLVSDRWLLSATTRGLEGPVELRVLGCEQRLVANLAGDRLQVVEAPGRASAERAGLEGHAPVGEPKTAELLLASLQLEFGQLAALVSGTPLPLVNDWLQQVVLRWGGQPQLAGRLVQHAGGVGLETCALYSTR